MKTLQLQQQILFLDQILQWQKAQAKEDYEIIAQRTRRALHSPVTWLGVFILAWWNRRGIIRIVKRPALWKSLAWRLLTIL